MKNDSDNLSISIKILLETLLNAYYKLKRLQAKHVNRDYPNDDSGYRQEVKCLFRHL